MRSPYKALVAFTAVVKDAKDGQEYLEAKINGFPVSGSSMGSGRYLLLFFDF